jgi:hypothetical protein
MFGFVRHLPWTITSEDASFDDCVGIADAPFLGPSVQCPCDHPAQANPAYGNCILFSFLSKNP